MSENGGSPTKNLVMAVPEPTREQLEELRARLLRAAPHGRVRIPTNDVEDVTQEALVKLVREKPKDNPPPLLVRGFTALRQAKVDYVRQRNRAKEPPLEALDDHIEVGHPDAGLRLLELEEMVMWEAGPDALRFARARQAGMTEAELAAEPGWTPQRAGAARRRLQRGIDRLRNELLDD